MKKFLVGTIAITALMTNVSSVRAFDFEDIFSEEFNELGEEFGELGKEFGELGEEFGKFGEEFGAEFEEFGEEFGKFGEEFGEEFGAEFEEFGEEFGKFGEEFEEFGKEFKQEFGMGLGEGIVSLLGGLDSFELDFDNSFWDGKLKKQENVVNNVNTSSTPNGELTFENITTININVFDIPVIIEEVDVAEITVLDTALLNNVPIDATNIISAQNGTLTFKEYGTNIKNTKIENECIEGNLLIQIPHGQVLDYEFDSFESDITLNALSDNLSVNAFDTNVEILAGGKDIELSCFGGQIYIYEAFSDISVNSSTTNVYLVADETTDNISINSFGADTTIEIENNAPYEITKYSLFSNVDDSYSNSAAIGIDIELNSVSTNLALKDWRD